MEARVENNAIGTYILGTVSSVLHVSLLIFTSLLTQVVFPAFYRIN
jgi:hypothetical protein